jgi:Prealbumin-like fold domain/Putative Flp pilus-assembly TadE/G-like
MRSSRTPRGGSSAGGDENGQILIITAVSLAVLTLVAALVVNVGHWWVHKRHLQTQVDAAALAGSSAFSGCFVNPALANTNIRNAALAFAGDQNRLPTTENEQVSPKKTNGVHVLLNSADYWPTSVADNSGTGFGPPCSTRWIDVKGTDDDVPPIFGFLSFLPDVKARARVSIRQVEQFQGVLPWSVPEVEPASVTALIVNETGSVIDNVPLPKGSVQPVNGVNIQLYNGIKNVTLPPGKADVVILTSTSATPTLGATVDAACGVTGNACYAGSAAANGLAMIRTRANTGTAAAGTPHLTGFRLDPGNCSGDTANGSAGYFLRNADCSPQAVATIDFGAGAPANPTASPLFARVYLKVSPTGATDPCPDPGCPMTYSTGATAWQAAVPHVDFGTGPFTYSLRWQTGGAGPGGLSVASRQKLGHLSSIDSGERSLAAVTRATAACSGNNARIHVRKVLDNRSALGGLNYTDFSYVVSDGCEQTGTFSNGNTVDISVPNQGNPNFDVVEQNPPTTIYTVSYSNSANSSLNCQDLKGNGGGDTCTITNTARVGSFKVTKDLTNDDSGTTPVTGFSFTLSYRDVQGVTQTSAPYFFDSDGTKTVPLVAGSRVTGVVETAAPGYAPATYTACPTAASPLTIVANVTNATCRIANDDLGPGKGTLIINKVITEDDGGAKIASGFSFRIDGGAPQPFPASGQSTILVNAGVHSVIEVADAGYTTTYQNSLNAAANCTNLNVPKGGTVTCTITNNDIAPTLRLVKAVDNSAGGTAVTANWTLSATAAPPNAARNFSYAGNVGTVTTVFAGAGYTLAEVGGLPATAGYALTGLSCTAGTRVGSVLTLQPGDAAVCTFTNTFGGVTLPFETGTFDDVAMTYARDLNAGPVQYLRITDGAGTGYFFTGGTHQLSISAGVDGALEASRISDPPVFLRKASGATGSTTQILDCDFQRSPAEEIDTGCFTPYRINAASSCQPPSPYNLPSSLPPPTTSPNPVPDCVAQKPTSAQNSINTGLALRYETPCTNNNWPKTNTDPIPADTDPRWVTLIVTSFDAFIAQGNQDGNIPVLRFARFYVTGWGPGGAGPHRLLGCPALPPAYRNETPPPGSAYGDIWGHYSGYVAMNQSGSAVPGETACDFADTTVCVATLDR